MYIASYPDRSQLFDVTCFSACNIEKLGVAWVRGYPDLSQTSLRCFKLFNVKTLKNWEGLYFADLGDLGDLVSYSQALIIVCE